MGSRSCEFREMVVDLIPRLYDVAVGRLGYEHQTIPVILQQPEEVVVDAIEIER